MNKTCNSNSGPMSVISCVAMLLMAVFLHGCGGGTEPRSVETSQPDNMVSTAVPVEKFVVLALGDSLTEGLGVAKDGNYPALLEAALHAEGYPQVEVVNSGLSGETSSGLLARVDWVLQLKPKITILNIGANDAMRGLPLDLTTRNINEIIKRIKASGSEVIIAGMQIYDNLGREYVAGFKDVYPLMAEQHELTMIPFFLEHVAGDSQYNQADMIHPTRAGYEVIVSRNVLPVVLPIISERLTTTNQNLKKQHD